MKSIEQPDPICCATKFPKILATESKEVGSTVVGKQTEVRGEVTCSQPLMDIRD